MSQSVVAKRYAVALFEIGMGKSNLDQLEEELRVIDDVFKNDESLNAFLDNPRVSGDQKKEFIRNVFKDVSQDTLNTLLLLIDKRRIDSIEDVVKAFVEMKNESRGIAEADVYSVRELTDEETKQIQDVFAKKMTINTLRINNTVDPSIIGGIKIRVGNQIYDGTVQTQLKRLEQKLVTANK
ncbi:F0F1 ATP synthase subunit delta [Tenuibacillus multivorans]|uniref:ATP synthase subunit delta n=1 Tax=Tenuibacillus multivorans TaxID=237069 RepID=A0A1G9X404_9BACI|nr:F0F1 ATP synthase subunit delta [Tenuibacillus multivorans]GEL77249.1 ATP synthase subunit delta [Tenuibacillus multivorans]SDM91085.1 F-type H+-transporting ATPase subunit delta [Tenuibacillus multivorans]